MHKKVLNLLIATCNDRILGLKNMVNKYENVVFTISHQIYCSLSKEAIDYIDFLRKQEFVIYSQILSKGVAINRNNALKYRIKNSICLLCDDDVEYLENAFSDILKAFETNQVADILTFKVKDFNGNDYKSFRNFQFKHNIKTLSNIGIIDIAFREEIIDKYNLSFDERFGPGGKYSIGEDFVFVYDALKMGLSIYFIPTYIVKHPNGGTGQTISEEIIYGRGAMFARVFGLLSFLVNLYFSTKNYKKYNHKISYFSYNKLLFKGSFDYVAKK